MDSKQFEVEKEHSRYENAIREIEQLADHGVSVNGSEKNDVLVEIREKASEVL